MDGQVIAIELRKWRLAWPISGDQKTRRREAISGSGRPSESLSTKVVISALNWGWKALFFFVYVEFDWPNAKSSHRCAGEGNCSYEDGIH